MSEGPSPFSESCLHSATSISPRTTNVPQGAYSANSSAAGTRPRPRLITEVVWPPHALRVRPPAISSASFLARYASSAAYSASMTAQYARSITTTLGPRLLRPFSGPCPRHVPLSWSGAPPARWRRACSMTSARRPTGPRSSPDLRRPCGAARRRSPQPLHALTRRATRGQSWPCPALLLPGPALPALGR